MSAAETARVRRDAEIIPADLAVKAMRDSGYKNTAYALAELIDNSVQAEATDIEVFCLEERQLVNERERRRIRQVAVLDNGKGELSNRVAEMWALRRLWGMRSL